MILIVSHKEDYTTDYLIDKLNKSKKLYYRFNCEDLLKNDIALYFGEREKHFLNNFSNFKSVWYRRTKLPDLQGINIDEKNYLLNEMDIFLTNLFGIIKGKWLSNPSAIAKAENKFLQLSIARKIGLKVPKTLVTNNRERLLQFIESNKRTIIKPIGRGRIDFSNNTSKLIFTNIIPDSIIKEINSFELTPAIYQEYIEKDYEIRVTIVGKDVFAAKID